MVEITDDPDNWIKHDGLWQYLWRLEAFSIDKGKHYYLQSENQGRGITNLVFHQSKHIEQETDSDVPR